MIIIVIVIIIFSIIINKVGSNLADIDMFTLIQDTPTLCTQRLGPNS